VLKRFIRVVPLITIVFAIFSVFGLKSYAAEVGHTTVMGGVNYSAVYDYSYYVNKYPDLKKAFGNDDVAVLNHFVASGMAEGRQANANFDVSSYKNAYPDLRAAFGSNLKSYYMHYIVTGKSEGRTATGVTELVGGVTRVGGVDYSAVYDYNYYMTKYPDLKKAFGNNDIAALNHFVANGMAEGRQANANFDISSYKNVNPDLRIAFGSNLKLYYMHYIHPGKAEGRTATGITKLVAVTRVGGVDYSAVYDYNYYMTKYPDLKKAFGNNDIAALNHFVASGMAEGRQGNANFDVSSYKNAYPDLRAVFGSNLKLYYMHYLSSGKVEGRTSTGVTQLVGTTRLGGTDYSAVYNYQYYISKNPDIQKAFGNNDVATLNHFVTSGMAEGRQASDNFNASVYKGNYVDLQEVFGSNLKSYYLHYLGSGKSEGRTGKVQIHNYIRTVTVGGFKVYTCSICEDTYKIGGLKLGVDVSYAQGNIDWQKVKDSGINFAIIRCGFGDDISSQDDTQFLYNVQECERLGIPWGTYLYSYAKNITGSDASAESEYQHIMRLLQGKHPTLPIYVDMEEHTGGNYVAIANYICSKLKSAGYNSGVYANLNWWNNILDNSCFNSYERWVAQYYKECQYTGAYHVWQYTSGGTVRGINGSVDMDVLIN